MIKLTESAAREVVRQARESGMEGMALRIAARVDPGGGIDYGMGFDEIKDSDMLISSQGAEVVVAPAYKALLQGAVLDYVEIEPGAFRFIVLNPNDPGYVAPTDVQSDTQRTEA
jgi:iron-sulfur cluster assembly protein